MKDFLAIKGYLERFIGSFLRKLIVHKFNFCAFGMSVRFRLGLEIRVVRATHIHM